MECMELQQQAVCWACGTTVILPHQDGMYAQSYKCGWCGAITQAMPPKQASEPSFHFRLFQTLRQLFVCLMWAILFSIPVIGMPFVLPHLVTGPGLAIHYVWGVFLGCNVYFNYWAAIFHHPGPVMGVLETARAPAAGCYEGYLFCLACQAPKPLVAHHCRTCVMEMDHHCIFLNSCVGLNNMRHFLLLIVFLLVGCIYVLASCIVLLLQQQDVVRAEWARVLVPILRSGQFWELLVITPKFVLSSPGWLAGTTYLAALSTGALPGLALLLTSELRLILRGQTYIESLQGRSTHPESSSLNALRRIFGCDHPITWVAIRWHPPPGSAAASQCYKKSN